jgi:alpha/beta superfamily hydrolase
MVALPEPLAPLMVLQGDQDDIVPNPAIVAWLLTRKCDYHFMKWAQVGHFFHGKLIEIKTEFKRWTHTLGERDGSTD